MDTSSFEQHLIQAGLSGEQARLYEALVRSGPSSASDIARRGAVSRTLSYKVLGELSGLGLVEKRDENGKVAEFIAAHPLKLKEIIERKQNEAKDALSALEGALGPLSSAYNIAGGKPGIEFFEGMGGIAKVLNDTLTAKEVIYTFADLKAIDESYRDLNTEYLEKRRRKGIQKKGILADTPFTRSMLSAYDTSVTDSRLIKYADAPSKTIIQMYDEKTSYIVVDCAEPVAMIVHDTHITNAHRSIFDVLWNYAEPFSSDESRSNTA